jgi:response regulator RpfG family c-di-GMP phosphodiesterase
VSQDREKHIVMIVDDNPVNLQILVEILKDDYDVVFATNGRDALDMAKMNHPDLILLDIQMPEMNGYEVITAIKSMPDMKGVPIIFLTAMSQQEDEAVGLKLGAADYITKPINPDLVRLRVCNHLELKSQRDLLKQQRDILAQKNEELEEHILRIKRLEGIISICMYCKKIRNEQQIWEQMELYISQHSDAMFSHGVCPDCYENFKKGIIK